jgi:hypothetical protein
MFEYLVISSTMVLLFFVSGLIESGFHTGFVFIGILLALSYIGIVIIIPLRIPFSKYEGPENQK